MGQGLIGIIGGSGLYEMEGLEKVEERRIETPFGPPSDAYIIGSLAGRRVAFLARHGRGHRLMPSELNFRANIFGFKLLGAEWIISASAVGSMREELPPLDIVIPDQFFDRTKGRISTFFGGGVVAHVSLADPTCQVLGKLLFAAAVGGRPHPSWRYLPVHRRAAIFYPSRVAGLSAMGSGCHWDDQSARGEALSRGRDLLRDAGPGHRL